MTRKVVVSIVLFHCYLLCQLIECKVTSALGEFFDPFHQKGRTLDSQFSSSVNIQQKRPNVGDVFNPFQIQQNNPVQLRNVKLHNPVAGASAPFVARQLPPKSHDPDLIAFDTQIFGTQPSNYRKEWAKGEIFIPTNNNNNNNNLLRMANTDIINNLPEFKALNSIVQPLDNDPGLTTNAAFIPSPTDSTKILDYQSVPITLNSIIQPIENSHTATVFKASPLDPFNIPIAQHQSAPTTINENRNLKLQPFGAAADSLIKNQKNSIRSNYKIPRPRIEKKPTKFKAKELHQSVPTTTHHDIIGLKPPSLPVVEELKDVRAENSKIVTQDIIVDPSNHHHNHHHDHHHGHNGHHDDGHHSEHDSSGGGHENSEKHHNSHGEEDSEKYKHNHHHETSKHGKHGEHHDQSDYKEKGGHNEKHHDEGSHYKDHHEAHKSHKSGKFGEKKGHKRGHKTKGFHNKFHRDEYHREHRFYDDAHKEGYHEKHGDAHSSHKSEEGAHKNGGSHDSGHDSDHHGKKGFSDKGHIDEEHKGFHKDEGSDAYHKDHHDYAVKDGHNHGKHYGHSASHVDKEKRR